MSIEEEYEKSLNDPVGFIMDMDISEFEMWIRTDRYGNFDEDNCHNEVLMHIYNIIEGVEGLVEKEIRLLKRLAECKRKAGDSSE